MWISILAILVILLLLLILFEYRQRKPDSILLYESKGQVKQRQTRFYPRHFSLSIPKVVHTINPEIEAEAKGKLGVSVKLAASVTASTTHLTDLIRMGGWKEDAVIHAANEMQVRLISLVKAFCEQYAIEELSTENLTSYLKKQNVQLTDQVGLDILSLSVLAIDPLDEEVAEAMRQQESARLMEQTERLNQKARIAASRARIDADNEIAEAEHKLELKRLQLKRVAEKEEAQLAQIRVQEEIKRKEMELAFDRKEMETLKNNPELLLLTPQIARLAEASQQLRNAKTIVSLSSQETNQGNGVMASLQMLLQNILHTVQGEKEPKA